MFLSLGFRELRKNVKLCETHRSLSVEEDKPQLGVRCLQAVNCWGQSVQVEVFVWHRPRIKRLQE